MSFNDAETVADPNSTDRISLESRAKFTADGKPRRFTGATVICHLQEARASDTIYGSIVENFYNVTNKEVFSKYVQLPRDSLHMTLYDTRVYDGRTPARNEENRVSDMVKFRQAFSALQPQLQKLLPVKMTIDLSTTRHPELGGTVKVPVIPYDEKEKNKLRSIRTLICSAFNVPPPSETYEFHITVYYAVQYLSEAQFSVLQQHWANSVKKISEAVPSFEIDRIELCSFESMFHFAVQDTIRPGP